jgi:WD40 repeat protein
MWEVDSGKLLYTLAEPASALGSTPTDDPKSSSGGGVPGGGPGGGGFGGILYSRLAFSPDGTFLLTSGLSSIDKDGKTTFAPLAAWRVATGKEEYQVISPAGSRLYSVAFSPDGERLAILWLRASGKSTAQSKGFELWLHDGQTGKALHSIGDDHVAHKDMDFSPDGNSLLTTSASGVVELWDVDSGKLQRKLLASTGTLAAAGFGPDGKQLFTTGVEKTVKVWQARHLAPFHVRPKSGDTALLPSLSGDGKRLAVAFRKIAVEKIEPPLDEAGGFTPPKIVPIHLIRVLDTTTGHELFALKDPELPVSKIFLSADGKRLSVFQNKPADKEAGIKATMEVVTWDVDTEAQLGAFSIPVATSAQGGFSDFVGGPGGGFAGNRLTPTFAPDGNRLAYSYQNSDKKPWLKVVELPSGKEIFDRPLQSLTKGQMFVGPLYFSTDGKFIAFSVRGSTKIGDAFNTALPSEFRIVDLATGNESSPPLPLKGPSFLTMAVVFSPDGKWMAQADRLSAALGTAPDIIIHDVATGKELARMTGHTANPSSFAFSPDGQRLVSFAQPGFRPAELKVWDAHNGHELLTLAPELPFTSGTVHFSNDGHQIFFLSSNGIGSPFTSGLRMSHSLQVWDGSPLAENK